MSDLPSLFARYLDISFDLPQDPLAESVASDHFSSPRSSGTDLGDTPTSKQSLSTSHTTPLRFSPISPHSSKGLTIEGFLDQVEAANLPGICKEGFTRLAVQIRELALLVVPPEGDHAGGYNRKNRHKVGRQSRSISLQVQESNCKVADQVANIENLKALALFTVEPSAQDSWCIYRQRAILISK